MRRETGCCVKPPKVLAVILAGGTGGRLGPLTDHRAKPALPVAGTYRLIDIPLSNLRNSGLSDVWVVEQYQPASINDHLSNGRPWDLDRNTGGLRVLPPFQGREGEGFAEGNADGLFRQGAFIREFAPDLVLVLSADHLYSLDYRDVLRTHAAADAALTIVSTRFDGDASKHGVLQVADGMVTDFQYKPAEPASDLVAAEVFLYSTNELLESLEKLHETEDGLHDYGDELLPYFVATGRVADHRLDGYWLDLGTPANYHAAHMDLLDGKGLDFDNSEWPMLTGSPRRLPAFVGGCGDVGGSLVSPGSKVFGRVRRSVIGTDATVAAGSDVVDSVLMEGVTVEAGATVRNAIVDAGAVIRQGTRVDGTHALIVVDRNGTAEHQHG